MGENEFGLFKALVCINANTAIMTTIKCYVHDSCSSPGSYIPGMNGRGKSENLEVIRKRLLDPSNRRRKAVKSGT